MFKTRRIFLCGKERTTGEEHCCGLSGSSVLELALQLGSIILVYWYTDDHVCTQARPAQNRLGPDLPERTIASIGEQVQILTLSTVFELKSPNALFPWDFLSNVIRLHFVSLNFPSYSNNISNVSRQRLDYYIDARQNTVKLIVQTPWWWTIICSKHVQENLI
jgi:hypothetical protein